MNLRQANGNIFFIKLFLAIIFFSFAAADGARAVTLSVTNTNDSGAGSLRQAIADALPGDTIDFNLPHCPCTILLTSGGYEINKNLRIIGPGADQLRIDGINVNDADRRRIFVINSATVTLDGLTITHSRLSNSAGIANTGNLTLTNSVVSENGGSVFGSGGIINTGTLTVKNSAIINNFAGGTGGIYNIGNATIINSTISGNSTITGGGIYSSGNLTVINSTITNNHAGSNLELGGSGLNIASGTAKLYNTIVANNSRFYDGTQDDILGVIAMANNNLIGNVAFSGGVMHGTNGNQVGNSGLGIIDINTVLDTALTGNGGSTPTHALAPGSPAIDSGNSALAVDEFGNPLLTDQRGAGFARVLGAAVDIGAVEFNPPAAGRQLIAFASTRTFPDSIHLMNPDGSNVLSLTAGLQTGFEFTPSISRDANRVAYISGSAQVFIINTDGTNRMQLTAPLNRPGGNLAALNSDPAFNYAGNKIVFSSNRDIPIGDAISSDIYVMNTDGSNVLRLTLGEGGNAQPSFSPDNSKIVFSSSRDGNREIYVMNADGSNPVRLTNNLVSDSYPEFTPDGSKIVFSSNGDIWIMNIDGSNPVNLTNNPAEDGSPTVSPDGSKIAFTTNRDGNYEIYAMNIDGSNPVNITNNPAIDLLPSWGGIPNAAPTIIAVGATVTQNAVAANYQIASVSDAEDAENALSVTVNGASEATVSGVTVSDIAVDSSGNVTANIAAGCGASDAAFTLRVADSNSLFAEATLNVSVMNETTAPVLVLPSDIVAYLPLNSTDTGKAVDFTISATDNCTAAPTITSDPPSGSVFPVGTTTVNVTATDVLGNTTTGSFTVTVLYNFAGFFQPVDNLPMVNLVSAGQSIPLRFSLYGNKGLDIFAAGYPVSQQIACSTGSPVSLIEETVTTGANGLNYDAGGDRYTYFWKTEKGWRGTCRQMVFKLKDGAIYAANFQFR